LWPAREFNVAARAGARGQLHDQLVLLCQTNSVLGRVGKIASLRGCRWAIRVFTPVCRRATACAILPTRMAGAMRLCPPYGAAEASRYLDSSRERSTGSSLLKNPASQNAGITTRLSLQSKVHAALYRYRSWSS
jgi:hypothetical protein